MHSHCTQDALYTDAVRCVPQPLHLRAVKRLARTSLLDSLHTLLLLADRRHIRTGRGAAAPRR